MVYASMWCLRSDALRCCAWLPTLSATEATELEGLVRSYESGAMPVGVLGDWLEDRGQPRWWAWHLRAATPGRPSN